jgi:hypothetical protein
MTLPHIEQLAILPTTLEQPPIMPPTIISATIMSLMMKVRKTPLKVKA